MIPMDDSRALGIAKEFSDQGQTVWWGLKPGYLGLVLWAIERDEQFVASFCDALSNANDLDAVARSLLYPVTAASNALGQAGLHQFTGDESKHPHMEPRDSRWGPLMAFSDDALEWITLAIAHHPAFGTRLQSTLSAAVEAVKTGKLSRGYDLHTIPEAKELFNEFLVCLGAALDHVLRSNGKTLHEVLTEIGRRNRDMQAPLYNFQRKPRDTYYRLRC